MASGLDKRQPIDASLLDFSKTLACIQSCLADRYQIVVLDGKTSSSSPVSSGVPQGTVFGPLLLLIYINELPFRVASTARHFADECLLYRVISNPKDAASVQEGLDRLQEWERDWQMVFNPDKCEHIRIINNRNIVQSTYKIHVLVIKETTKAKCLGITIDRTLSWNSHTDTVTIGPIRLSPSYRGTYQPAQGT